MPDGFIALPCGAVRAEMQDFSVFTFVVLCRVSVPEFVGTGEEAMVFLFE